MKANSEIEDVVPKNERAGEAGPSAPTNQETISGPETALVQDWYKAAGEVADFEGLGKALERVIRSFPGGRYHPTCSCRRSLGGPKIHVRDSRHGFERGYQKGMHVDTGANVKRRRGAMALLRYSDLLLPGGAEGYLEVPAEIGGWLKVKAISTLYGKGQPPTGQTRTHLEELSKGNLPGGFGLNNLRNLGITIIERQLCLLLAKNKRGTLNESKSIL